MKKNLIQIKVNFILKQVLHRLNKFGQLLHDWNPMIEKEMTWETEL